MTFTRYILVIFILLAGSDFSNTYAEEKDNAGIPELELSKRSQKTLSLDSRYVLTEAEVTWLKNHSSFTVGIDKHWYPYEFVDDQGHYAGIAADYLEFASQVLEVEFDIVETTNWNEAHRLFKQGKIDILPAMIATESRQKETLFSQAYFTTPTVIVSRKNAFYATSIESLEGKRLALVKGYAIVEYVKTNYPEIDIFLVESIQQGLDAVNNGETQAYIGAISGINSALNKSDFSQLIISAFTPFDLQVSMAISNKIEPMASILNKVFNTMSNRQKAAIANTWLSIHVAKGVSIKSIALWGGPPLVLLVVVVFIIIRLNQGLKKEIGVRQKVEEKLKHLAQHDPLTNLPNRRLFEELAHFSLAKARREDEKHALLFVDIDGFKTVNDKYGHQIGDELLQSIAARLRENIRTSDIVARHGGDEFLILLSNDGCREYSKNTAEKIINEISRPYQLSKEINSVGASIGISTYPDDGEDLQSLVELADSAMYQAKNAGKNRYSFSSD
ncbi:MAG: diguanylate cyclase [Kangiellaceae bacterium]|nr:diguanylate cyclase [Kangiellaceae bacterium]MCW9018044.1 diguanylate cyclase [Kangiellaceae bacterium]